MREKSMKEPEERYEHSHDAVAKVIAFLSPYLFWLTVGAILGGIVILQS
jgi:hypothetical protein